MDELVHQLRISEATLIIVHPQFLQTAQAAAKIVGISQDRIILIQKMPNSTNVTLDELVEFGSNQHSNVVPIRLRPGEGKTRLAFLSFSSGTTGQS